MRDGQLDDLWNALGGVQEAMENNTAMLDKINENLEKLILVVGLTVCGAREDEGGEGDS